jgi:hypothetical protein
MVILPQFEKSFPIFDQNLPGAEMVYEKPGAIKQCRPTWTEFNATLIGHCPGRLIPRLADQDLWAQLRSPKVMMRQG